MKLTKVRVIKASGKFNIGDILYTYASMEEYDHAITIKLIWAMEKDVVLCYLTTSCFDCSKRAHDCGEYFFLGQLEEV